MANRISERSLSCRMSQEVEWSVIPRCVHSVLFDGSDAGQPHAGTKTNLKCEAGNIAGVSVLNMPEHRLD